MLKGKTAVITGASKGIGRAIACHLAEAGTSLVVVARSEDLLISLQQELESTHSVSVHPVVADVSTEAGARALYQAATQKFSHIDILINNVGVGKYGSITNLSVKDYDWMMNSNMRSSFLCTHAFLPDMLKRTQGWIIFIGSVAGLRGLPNEAVYCASKFAQTGFAQALDYEVRKQGIKVSVIAPGGVNTEFAIGTGRTKGDSILEKMMSADDVAQATLFALQQPEKARVFLVGMRPMSEPL